MNEYKLLNIIGEGTFGTVYRAEHIITKEIVAIKKIKKEFHSLKDGENTSELKYSDLSHQNIIEIKHVILEENTLFYVMEIMDCNLYEYLEKEKHLSEDTVRLIMYQIFQGIAFLHRNDIFHRDLKPENILLRESEVKITDFGLARSVHDFPPYTTYVSTRWYRAPEILLRSRRYSKAIDIWAAGCIMAELLNSSPLFPGINEEDQLVRICRVLGSPTVDNWMEGISLAKNCCFRFPNYKGFSPIGRFPHASNKARDLVNKLLVWNPEKRLTAEEALKHPYFVDAFRPF